MDDPDNFELSVTSCYTPGSGWRDWMLDTVVGASRRTDTEGVKYPKLTWGIQELRNVVPYSRWRGRSDSNKMVMESNRMVFRLTVDPTHVKTFRRRKDAGQPPPKFTKNSDDWTEACTEAGLRDQVVKLEALLKRYPPKKPADLAKSLDKAEATLRKVTERGQDQGLSRSDKAADKVAKDIVGRIKSIGEDVTKHGCGRLGVTWHDLEALAANLSCRDWNRPRKKFNFELNAGHESADVCVLTRVPVPLLHCCGWCCVRHVDMTAVAIGRACVFCWVHESIACNDAHPNTERGTVAMS